MFRLNGRLTRACRFFSMSHGLPDEFAPVASNYAKFRPHYPEQLFSDLSHSLSENSRAVAVDIGTGSGQMAVDLAKIFSHVIGIDKSAEQLRNAAQAPNIEYRVGTATQTQLENSCADFVMAAQAAHWFDLPVYFQEVKRVLKPGGALGIAGYGMSRLLDPEAQACFQRYCDTLEEYWPRPCDRSLLENAFSSVQIPFARVQTHRYPIRKQMPIESFLGYVRTWSALQAYLNQHPDQPNPSNPFEQSLKSLPAYEAAGSIVEVETPFFLVIGHDE
eukprot:TRINITY_DN1866_c0_g1_i2.p1 TRINITY_DN1866_c0_g1~~TRINITY_DN1866_c0_g1_i2.p1  ORF type:complete len:275 (+),score=50.56 TRINITY_DN1866_c0_g1_i2:40-864(+)